MAVLYGLYLKKQLQDSTALAGAPIISPANLSAILLPWFWWCQVVIRNSQPGSRWCRFLFQFFLWSVDWFLRSCLIFLQWEAEVMMPGHTQSKRTLSSSLWTPLIPTQTPSVLISCHYVKGQILFCLIWCRKKWCNARHTSISHGHYQRFKFWLKYFKNFTFSFSLASTALSHPSPDSDKYSFYEWFYASIQPSLLVEGYSSGAQPRNRDDGK